MGIEDEYAAYCFDAAVRTWGVWIENKLSERTNLGYPRYSLQGLLSSDNPDDWKKGRLEGQFGSGADLIESAERQ